MKPIRQYQNEVPKYEENVTAMSSTTISRDIEYLKADTETEEQLLQKAKQSLEVFYGDEKTFGSSAKLLNLKAVQQKKVEQQQGGNIFDSRIVKFLGIREAVDVATQSVKELLTLLSHRDNILKVPNTQDLIIRRVRLRNLTRES